MTTNKMTMKIELPKELPNKDQCLRIKLDPNGFHDTMDFHHVESCINVGNLPTAIQSAISHIQARNVKEGIKDNNKVRYSLVNWRDTKAPCD